MAQSSPHEEEIFKIAWEMASPEARESYLTSACGDDPALQERIRALLRVAEEEVSFMDRPAIECAATELLADTTNDPDTAGSRTTPYVDDIPLDFLEPAQRAGSLGRLGQYDILETIGRGGMGIVLKAHDAKLNRVAAVKVLAPELASNPTARKRFEREAQAAAAVSHDHVVTIFAVETGDAHNGLPYLVMEFIDGESLQQKIDREGALELKEILRIGRQIASGLAAAHEQGLIHRDVKPSNILLQNGVQRVQITDFGLARAVDDVGMTKTGEITGTPQYMSPEQAQGMLVDARSDLFSLGSLLYAMCTGRGPFRADSSVASLRRVCDDTPRPVRETNPDIPIWLVEIIDSLLEKDPERRFQSAAEVSELLAKCLARLQEVGPTSMTGIVVPKDHHAAKQPSAQRPRRHSWLVPAVALLILGLAFGVTEATGVTDFSATVVRIVTGEGTLVIEVDDPTVQIALDGEELSITGGGLQEIRLRPGQYQFQAFRDGEPLTPELVTITRGDRQVVRVTREIDEPGVRIVHPTTEPDQAFVVLRGDGVSVVRFSSLSDAVLGSTPGDTIEIRGNGPFVTQPVEMSHALTIRAGDGFHPVIVGDPTVSLSFGVNLIDAKDRIVLEGLEIRYEHDEDRSTDAMLVRAHAEIAVRNCRLEMVRHGCPLHVRDNGVIQNCILIAGNDASPSVSWRAQSGGTFGVENSLLIGQLNIGAQDVRDAILRLTHNTMLGLGYQNFINLAFDNPADRPSVAPGQKPLRVIASENMVQTGYAVLASVNASLIQNGSDDPAEIQLAEELLSEFLDWQEQGNLYRIDEGFLVVQIEESSRENGWERSNQPTLEAWNQFWGLEGTGSRVDGIRFEGGSLFERAQLDAHQLAAPDFLLREDSAGYQAGPNGEDLGANIDFVGPGEAYARWKRTEEYHQWRKQTDVLMSREATQARKPFVVLRGDGQAAGSFDSLADAVLGSTPGDTIEIRGNGPFVTQPVEIKHPLTIRAGDGFHPEIVADATVTLEWETPFINAIDSLALEGLHLRTDPGQLAGGGAFLVGSYDAVRMANCRLVMACSGGCLFARAAVELRNCSLQVARGGAPAILRNCSLDHTCDIENCIVVGQLLVHTVKDFQTATLSLTHNTMIDRHFSNVLYFVVPDFVVEASVTRQEPLFRVNASENVLQASYHVLASSIVSTDANPIELDAAEELLVEFVDWEERRNLYRAEAGFLGMSDEHSRETTRTTLEEWNQVWGLQNTESSIDLVRFSGGNLLERAANDSHEFLAEDFRLRPDSAGYQVGLNSEDLGANIDFVGPGKAYARWKQTDEYQQWREQTDALMAGAVVSDGSLHLSRQLRGHAAAVKKIVYFDDGQRVLTSSHDATIRIWNVLTGELQEILPVSVKGWAEPIDLAPDQQLIALEGGAIGSILLFNIETGASVNQLVGHTENVGYLEFSPDGSQLLSRSRDSSLRLWDVTSGTETYRLDCGPDWACRAAAFSPDGSQLLYGDLDHVILWDIHTQEPIHRLPMTAYSGQIMRVAFAPDGLQFAAVTVPGIVHVWNAATGELQGTIDIAARPSSIEFSPGGQHLITSGTDKTLRVWSLESLSETHRFTATENSINEFAISPDGRHIVAGSGIYFDPEEGEWVVNGEYRLSVFESPETLWDAAPPEFNRE